jgi:hypothetical protein
MYKLSFEICETGDTASVIDILKKKLLFKLIQKLNEDLINKIDITEENNISIVVIKYKNNYNEEIILHLKLKYNFFDDLNKCIINSIPFEKIEKIENTDKNNIYINDFNITFEKKQKTCVLLTFNVDNVFDNNLQQMYIGLHFKKLFNRFKLYFE